jgi:hypothetical protein
MAEDERDEEGAIDLSALAPRGPHWERAIEGVAARAHARHAASRSFAGQVLRLGRPLFLLAAAAVALAWVARTSAPGPASGTHVEPLSWVEQGGEPYEILTWAAQHGGAR